MTSRKIGIPSRIAFFFCGMISLTMSSLYRALRALVPAIQMQWSVYAAILMMVGGFGVLIALLPGSWIERGVGIDANDQAPLSIPIKMLGGFAGFAYVLTAALAIVSPKWHLGPQLVYSLCPACPMMITVDPSLWSVLTLLAPLDAATYGAFGAALGFAFVTARRRM